MKRSGLQTTHSGFVRDISEGSVAVVAIEGVLAVLSHKQIWKAVIVKISPHTAQPVASAWHASLIRDVGKCPIVIAAMEGIRDRYTAVVKISPVYEINVRPTVTVEVGHAHSRTKFFPIDRDSLVTLEMLELDAGRLSNIRKLNRRRRRRLGT